MKITYSVPVPRPKCYDIVVDLRFLVLARGTGKVYAAFTTQEGALCHLKHHPQGSSWAQVLDTKTGETF